MNTPRSFLDGYGGAPVRVPPRSNAAPGWVPGSQTVTVQALCCPTCGSLQVRGRDNGATQVTQRYECADCASSWRASPGPTLRCLVLRQP